MKGRPGTEFPGPLLFLFSQGFYWPRGLVRQSPEVMDLRRDSGRYSYILKTYKKKMGPGEFFPQPSPLSPG
jgi:hypothetical protein